MGFLRNARQLLAGGPLLLGLDQPRAPALMEAAYDDAAGVSAAFARNLLQRLNRDLQGDADPTQFRYRAHWQATQQRIEMALVSTQDQTVHLGGEAWFFRQGDAWITEHSVKYSPYAAEPIHTSRSLFNAFAGKLSPKIATRSSGGMKSDERRQAIKRQREQLIQDLETVYMAAFDRLPSFV